MRSWLGPRLLLGSRSMSTTERPNIRAPRGSTLSCKGWVQEAALRMLMNNLDREVAEAPERLVVYGGTGKAARSWPDYHRIVASLKDLEDDETELELELEDDETEGGGIVISILPEVEMTDEEYILSFFRNEDGEFYYDAEGTPIPVGDMHGYSIDEEEL